MPMAIKVGAIVTTIGEKDNGDRIVNGMEMLANENDPDTVVGMTTVGKFELSLCLLLVAPWMLDWHCGFWALRSSSSMWVSTVSTPLTGVIWSSFARRPCE